MWLWQMKMPNQKLLTLEMMLSRAMVTDTDNLEKAWQHHFHSSATNWNWNVTHYSRNGNSTLGSAVTLCNVLSIIDCMTSCAYFLVAFSSQVPMTHSQEMTSEVRRGTCLLRVWKRPSSLRRMMMIRYEEYWWGCFRNHHTISYWQFDSNRECYSWIARYTLKH